MNEEKGFIKRVSNAIFQAKAQKEMDTNVRLQVWFFLTHYLTKRPALEAKSPIFPSIEKV